VVLLKPNVKLEKVRGMKEKIYSRNLGQFKTVEGLYAFDASCIF